RTPFRPSDGGYTGPRAHAALSTEPRKRSLSGEDELNPAILRPLGFVGAGGLQVALGDDLHVLGRDALGGEVLLDRLPAAVGQHDVVFLGAARVGVGFEVDEAVLLDQARRDLVELRLGVVGDLRAVEAEVDRVDATRVAPRRHTGEYARSAVADLVHRALVVGGALAGAAALRRAGAGGDVTGPAFALEVVRTSRTLARGADETAGAIDRLRARRTETPRAASRRDSARIHAAELVTSPIRAAGAFPEAIAVAGAVLALPVGALLTEILVAVLVFLALGVRRLLATGDRERDREHQRGEGELGEMSCSHRESPDHAAAASLPRTPRTRLVYHGRPWCQPRGNLGQARSAAGSARGTRRSG